MSAAQLELARNFEMRTIVVHGAVAGLFFAQTMSWQQFVDAVITSFLGGTVDDPTTAFGRAVLITLLTSCAAWAITATSRWCGSLSTASVENR